MLTSTIACVCGVQGELYSTLAWATGIVLRNPFDSLVDIPRKVTSFFAPSDAFLFVSSRGCVGVATLAIGVHKHIGFVSRQIHAQSTHESS